ncbi:hypothetical protein VTH06DRAFT_3170 [Thermothelomyces fergusii]
MPGCLCALGFRRKKTKSRNITTVPTNEKARLARAGNATPGATEAPPSEKKPYCHAEVTHVQSTGVRVRPGVNPAYSAYAAPVDTRWAGCAGAAKAVEAADEAADPEEAARRRAAREEQERLDFFQML